MFTAQIIVKHTRTLLEGKAKWRYPSCLFLSAKQLVCLSSFYGNTITLSIVVAQFQRQLGELEYYIDLVSG